MRESQSLRKRWRRKRRRQLFLRLLLLCVVLGGIGAGVYWLVKGGGIRPAPSAEAEPSQSRAPLPADTKASPAVTPAAAPAQKAASGDRTVVPEPEAPESAAPQGTAKPKKKKGKPEKTVKPAGAAGLVPESEPVEENYFDDAVFIGDSRTEGFGMYSGLSKAAFYTAKGLKVDTVFENTIKVDGKKMTIPKALEQKKFGKVYIMLGINELGWIYGDRFIDKYEELLDTVRKSQPDAVIYVQSILHVSLEKSKQDKIYNNKKINERNKLIRKMAEKEGVFYLDVNEAVTGSDGALPDDASPDGVHLNQKYCRKWKEYLMTHTGKGEQENGNAK